MKKFQNKIVLITGASSGIGRATALRLANLGAQVGLAARDSERLASVAAEIAKKGGKSLVIPTDVTEAEKCQSAVNQTVEEFGGLDILFCSAGLSMRGYFEGSNLQALEKVMQVNFFGTLYATHFALPHIKKSKGSMVAMSSLTGKRGIPSYGIYGASKFAVQGLYEALRLELRPAGVHVGIVSPGFVDTPLRENVLAPNGQVWPDPPPPPFRVWPVEKCVDRVIRLIEKRKAEALLPWFTGPLLALDKVVGRTLGDYLLMRRFPPEEKIADKID